MAGSTPFVPSGGPALGDETESFSYVGDGAASRTITPPHSTNHTIEGVMVSNTAGAFAFKMRSMPGDESSFGAGVTVNADGSFTLSAAVAAALNVLGVTYYYIIWH